MKTVLYFLLFIDPPFIDWNWTVIRLLLLFTFILSLGDLAK